jgi:hypothetical protein
MACAEPQAQAHGSLVTPDVIRREKQKLVPLVRLERTT